VQIFLIRHPRPCVEAGICYGQLDVDAEDPVPVANRLRALLPADIPLITSPLRRAQCLAAALHPQPLADARLMEIDFGEWEGRRWAEIDRVLLDAWAADVLNFTPPGGESAGALQTRAVACVSALKGTAVALVTHSGVMRALLGHWLKLPVGEWSQLKFEFGHVTLLELSDGNATLRYMNR
jgi:alpha-ribazole phosphatase